MYHLLARESTSATLTFCHSVRVCGDISRGNSIVYSREKEEHELQCWQSVGFCPKSQDFWSSDLLNIICKLGMLGYFFNMAPLSTIHLRTILGF